MLPGLSPFLHGGSSLVVTLVPQNLFWSFDSGLGQYEAVGNAQVMGGVAPFSYSWSAGVSVTIIGGSTNTPTFRSPSNGATFYNVMVTDAQGNTGSASGSIS